jgi:hypothetical protein
MSCPVFWTEDPSILLREAADFFPFHKGAQRCTTTALNSFTRFGIYLGILLAFMTTEWNYLLLSVGIAIIAAAAYHGMKTKGILREGFQSKATGSSSTPLQLEKFPEDGLVAGSDAADEYVNDVIGTKERTQPTGANPFMNVLLTEIGDNPMRPPAENGEFLKRQFSNVFQDRVYGDPGDVFQKTQNQRTWAVQPNTSIPNDQDSFQNWLYRTPGRTCKEGNARACTSATEGGNLTWLNA